MRIDYKKRTILSEEEQTQGEVEFMVNDTRLQLESSINATKRELSKQEARLLELKTSYPLSLDDIITTKDEIVSLKDGLNVLEELKVELGFTSIDEESLD